MIKFYLRNIQNNGGWVSGKETLLGTAETEEVYAIITPALEEYCKQMGGELSESVEDENGTSELNWKRTIGVYVEALEGSNRIAADAAAKELHLIADHLNKEGVSYPDGIPETPKVIPLESWVKDV